MITEQIVLKPNSNQLTAFESGYSQIYKFLIPRKWVLDPDTKGNGFAFVRGNYRIAVTQGLLKASVYLGNVCLFHFKITEYLLEPVRSFLEKPASQKPDFVAPANPANIIHL